VCAVNLADRSERASGCVLSSRFDQRAQAWDRCEQCVDTSALRQHAFRQVSRSHCEDSRRLVCFVQGLRDVVGRLLHIRPSRREQHFLQVPRSNGMRRGFAHDARFTDSTFDSRTRWRRSAACCATAAAGSAAAISWLPSRGIQLVPAEGLTRVGTALMSWSIGPAERRVRSPTDRGPPTSSVSDLCTHRPTSTP